MTQFTDEPYEVGSVFNHGSKKSNLNHLLNFQYEPRGNQRSKNNNYNNNNRRSLPVYNINHASKAKHNKEQYLHANCKFVVKKGRYEGHLTDPDLTVDWEKIEQIVLNSTEMPKCPICLDEPNAAKIAKCGHVFCWPCLLHYFALTDDDFRPCPICYDKIYKEDGVKSLATRIRPDFAVGDEIEMRLMRRERNSLFALPAGKWRPQLDAKHPDFNAPFNAYSQLLMASPQDVANGILATEKAQLEAQLARDRDEPESVFIVQALGMLEERLLATLTGNKNSVTEMEEIVEDDVVGVQHQDDPDDHHDEVVASVARSRMESSSSDSTTCSVSLDDDQQQPEESTVTVADLDLKQGVPKSTFYFYQSSDGQDIFLHALNVQMLVKEHGGALEKCPAVIRGKILEKDNTTMTEELRNKLRYLRHLPLGKHFEVCEVDLKGQLSKETLAEFEGQVSARKRSRQKRARNEKRRDQRIQVEKDKLLGQFPDPKLRIESSFHFPQVGENPAAALLAPVQLRRSTESLNSEDINVMDNFASFSPPDQHQQQPSFARMLKDGVAKPQMKRSETFPVHNVNHGDEDDEPVPEGYAAPPPQASIGDALALALEQAALNKEQNGNSSSSKKKKGKKMKGTKIVLGF